MSWRDDVTPAQAGDPAALERLREFLTPFLHGVALAHAPHHAVERLMPRLLDELGAVLLGADASAAGILALALARRLAKQAGQAGLEEQAHPDAALRDARQVLGRLRALPEGPREWLLLRLVEGVPGPELVEVTNAVAAELRAELERGATEAATALGQPQAFAGDAYLWELLGTPGPLLAQLEMQLPALRYDPQAAPAPAEAPHTAGTLQDLAPVGGPPRTPGRPGPFDQPDETAVGAPPHRAVPQAPTLPEVRAAPLGANPFEPVARTVAATDLPAEARGQLPEPAAPIPPGSQGNLKGLKVPPRGDGSAAAGNESSGKSGRSGAAADPVNGSPSTRGLRVPPRGDGSAASGTETSGKSGRSGPGRAEGDAGSRSGRLAPLGEGSGKNRSPAPLGGDDDDEATRTEPPRLVKPKEADVVTTPEQHGASILGLPTTMMPAVSKGAELRDGETRLQGLPAPPPTRLEGLAASPEPRLWSRQLLQGSSPWLVALALLVGGLLANWAGIFTVEKRARSNWQMVQVVVAAEDLPAGSTLTVDNVAVRMVPKLGERTDAIAGDALNFVLEQKLAVDVQLGDPLFHSQFVASRGNQRLSKRVAKTLRGYTIPTTALTAVAHHVKPGDLVDVVATFEMQGRQAKKTKDGQLTRGSTRAVTILQSVSVLATGRIADFTPGAAVDEHEKPYSHVTLLLTAEEAELVTLARTVGPLSLTLRNEDDQEQFAQREYTDVDTLLDGNRRRLANQRQRALVDQVKAIRSAPSPR